MAIVRASEFFVTSSDDYRSIWGEGNALIKMLLFFFLMKHALVPSSSDFVCEIWKSGKKSVNGLK